MKGYCLKKQGYFEIKRRYRDFYALRMCFIERYPGLYVPPVPKKKVSNESRVVLQERQFVLNIFWKDVTCCPYLMESEEFRVFISKTNNLEVALSGLSRLQTEGDDILNRITPYFNYTGYFPGKTIE